MLKYTARKVTSTNKLTLVRDQGCQTSWFDQESSDFQTFLLIKILLNSGTDFEDFLLISTDFQIFDDFIFSDTLNQ